MDPKQFIIESLEMSRGIMKQYLEDISDDEFFIRPAENANHIAWQLGHMLSAEHKMISVVASGARPELPEGFLLKHSKEACGSDSKDDFFPKETYVSLIDPIRDTTVQELKDIPVERLYDPLPEGLPEFVPSVGGLFQMCASHFFMHSGQVAVLRRKLGKPIVI